MDDRGYGFVTPCEGGKPIFLHVNGFVRRSRRPIVNDLVTYELGKDDQKRIRASKVRFSAEKAIRATRPSRNTGPLIFAGLFLLFIVTMTWLGRLPALVVAVYLAASVATYLVYSWDKFSARNNRRRTPEKTLHLLALFGGWPGAVVAHHVERHKSAKVSFRRVFWFTVIINCAALAWLLTPQGSKILLTLK